MSYTTLIATRYFRSRESGGFISFVTFIAILGVALGTASLIIALAVLGGFEKEITDKVVGFTSHVQVLGFQNQALTNYETHTREIEDSIQFVRSVAPFVSREALIRSREGVDGIFLKGIDPLKDISTTARYIVAGKYEIDRRQGSLPKLVIGKKLAVRLALEVGDRATVFGIGRLMEQGQLRVMQFRISGIYESGMAEYDDIYAFTSIVDAQTIFQMENAVSGYDVLLTRIDSAAGVSDRIQELLGYPHYARTVFENYRNLFSWIELQKQPVPIVLGLIIIVATVNIIGTLLMMVLGKTRELGILMSLGASRWGIAGIFLKQGVVIAIAGTILGDLLAYILCYTQMEYKFFSLPSDIYFMTSVPIFMSLWHYTVVSGISVGLCLISALIPARLASRMNPVNAIRFA